MSGEISATQENANAFGVEELKRALTTAFKAVVNSTVLDEEDGGEARAHSMHFRTLPPRSEFPEYYQIIKKPIALNMIKKRIPQYTSADAFLGDIGQMVSNARQFNDPNSQIVADADAMKTIAELTLAELMSSRENRAAVAAYQAALPSKPKRGCSSFIFFCNAERSAVAADGAQWLSATLSRVHIRCVCDVSCTRQASTPD